MSAEMSPAQRRVLRAVAAGGYYPTLLDQASRRVLIERKLLLEHYGHPPTFSLTDSGRAALLRDEPMDSTWFNL